MYGWRFSTLRILLDQQSHTWRPSDQPGQNRHPRHGEMEENKMNRDERANQKDGSPAVHMTTQKKLAIMSVLLPMAALSVFLTRPAMAAGSSCQFGGREYSDGACVATGCEWPGGYQICSDGQWLSCGSC